MTFYRCACGSQTAVGTLAPEKCVSCPKCNTTLEVSVELHSKPLMHEWVALLNNHTKKEYMRCARCAERKNIN